MKSLFIRQQQDFLLRAARRRPPRVVPDSVCRTPLNRLMSLHKLTHRTNFLEARFLWPSCWSQAINSESGFKLGFNEGGIATVCQSVPS